MDLNSLRGYFIEILSKKDIDDIHSATLEILKSTGVKVHNKDALEIFANGGAEVDFKTQIVKISPKLVEDSIEKVPPRWTWHARNPQNNIKMGDDKVHFIPAAIPPFVYDLETGQRRATKYSDCVNFSRLSDSLPYIADGWMMAWPQDVPQNISHIYMMKAVAENSDKCLRGRINGVQVAQDSIRIAEILSQTTDLAKKPIMIGMIEGLSPLAQYEDLAGGLIEYVKRGLPVLIACEIGSGGTGPVTIAGTLVQQNVEILSYMVLAQIVKPGAPLGYGTSSSVMDLKTGLFRYGAVELGMINVATAQIARYYKIPCRGTGGMSDSKALDMQAGYETAITVGMAAWGGANWILQSAGGLDMGMSVSYEKIVIDHEILGSIGRVFQGIRVDPEALAIDVIKEIGPGGHFLAHSHTMDNLKKEHFITELADTNPYSIWEEKGRKDIKDRAKEKVKALLEAYKPKPLDASVQAELDSFVQEVEERGAQESMS